MAETRKPKPAWLWPVVAIIGTLMVVSIFGVGGTLIVLGLGGIVIGLIAFGGKHVKGFSSNLAKAAALGAGFVLLISGTATAATSSQSMIAPFASVGDSAAQLRETPTATPTRTPTPKPTPTPVVVTKDEVVSEVVPFAAVTNDDAGRDVGTSAVVVAGANGERTITYRVTYTDGVETSRVVTSDVVSVAPVDEVTAVGTRQPRAAAPAPVVGGGGGGCDPNYSGACVPIASDVDCAGGSGDGPAYVRGPVQVIGSDIYKLDRDGDGIACDK